MKIVWMQNFKNLSGGVGRWREGEPNATVGFSHRLIVFSAFLLNERGAHPLGEKFKLEVLHKFKGETERVGRGGEEEREKRVGGGPWGLLEGGGIFGEEWGRGERLPGEGHLAVNRQLLIELRVTWAHRYPNSPLPSFFTYLSFCLSVPMSLSLSLSFSPLCLHFPFSSCFCSSLRTVSLLPLALHAFCLAYYNNLLYYSIVNCLKLTPPNG